MSYVLEFELLGLPKSPNMLMKRAAVRIKQGERVKWLSDIAKITMGKKPTKPLSKAKITATRFSSVRPDYDGLVGSFKFVIDALVRVGILVNDNMEVIVEREYLWEFVSPKGGKIRVRVEEVES